jgi:MFS family permease
MLALLRQRNFALLWSGGLVSQTGDYLLSIGVPVYVYLTTGSALTTSITLIVAFLPSILLGSVAGVFVDRWDRRRTMLISNLLLALGLLPLLLVHGKNTFWFLYMVLFFESCVSQFVLPAEQAFLPSLVDEQQLVTANALMSSSSNIARLGGAALGGILLGTLGLQSVALLDAISFFFVCLMLLLIRPPVASRQISSRHEQAQPATTLLSAWLRVGGEWLEGMHLVARQRALLVLFTFLAVTGVGEGIFGTMLVIFVSRVLHSGSVVYGTLLSIQMVGNLLGSVLVAQFGKRLPPLRSLWISACIFGVIDLLIIDIPAFYPSVALVMVLFVVVGIPSAFIIIQVQTLIQTLVEDKLRGRVSSAWMAVHSLTSLIGMLLAGGLGDRFGSIPLLNLQGGSYVFGGLLILLALRKQVSVEQQATVFEDTAQKLDTCADRS